ncbi:glycosyltransferase [Stackebrandtia albiflava]|nr:glycosyltransferase [Stackebrandtia albiflava]
MQPESNKGGPTPGMRGDPSDFPEAMLASYLKIADKRSKPALRNTALRTRSLAARELLAYAAGGPNVSLAQFMAAAHGDRSILPKRSSLIRSTKRFLELAQVIGLQKILPSDETDSFLLYELALEMFQPADLSPRDQTIHTQLALVTDRFERAVELYGVYGKISEKSRTFLELDFINPFVRSGSVERWLQMFNTLLPSPITLGSGITPFDSITSSHPHSTVSHEAKITVVITAFRPGRDLVTAVRSILDQTWQNIEVLIVDDASPAVHMAVLNECLDLDSRVRLITQPVNAGTYAARNTAIRAASGDFITFQDSDDWSHPLRLERQIEPLLQTPDVMATLSDALKLTNDLRLNRPGRTTRDISTASLMFRREPVVARIGFMDSVRKSADTEYHRRIVAAFGEGSVLRMDAVLGLVRMSEDSLSRSEFLAGWMHPARAAYRSAYGLWHEAIASGDADPYLSDRLEERPFQAPDHFTTKPASSVMDAKFDVIYASDWRPYGGPQKSMIEEIKALTRRGLRVGVMQMEAYRFMTKLKLPLCRPIQELINQDVVHHVLPSDHTEVRLLVIRYPLVLQFPSDAPTNVKPDNVVILANQAPSESDGTDLRYVPSACTKNARRLFHVEPMWCPQGPSVREVLEKLLPARQLAPFDMPGILDIDEWNFSRTGFRSQLPVIGRHSRDHWSKWPESRDRLLQVYPDSPNVDVRVMGGTDVAAGLLGGKIPLNWVSYDYDEVGVREFLYQLDFFIYFPHLVQIEAFGRAILEALAAGCVVILPHRFEATFKDAAVYCESFEVSEVVDGFRSSPSAFLRQSRLARQRVTERHSHQSYFDLVSRYLSPRIPEMPQGMITLSNQERKVVASE